MKKRLSKRITNSLIQASSFFINSYHESQTGSESITSGFPETKGKKRVTEWGATSSAVAALRMCGIASEQTNTIVDNSSRWLLSLMDSHGSWEASGIHLAEATAGVLLDLNIDGGNPIIATSIDFIKSCYKDKCFYSTPEGSVVPHLYTTYLATKCLYKYSRLEQGDKIRDWVLSCNTADNHWGQIPQSNVSTPVHTIFALNILHHCGMPWSEIATRFSEQIAWIKDNYLKADYIYEEVEVKQLDTDNYGQQYKRLRLRHYVLPYAGMLFLELQDYRHAFITAERVLAQQYNGGWGPSKDELTMWATQQSIEFLVKIQKCLPSASRHDVILAKLPVITHIWIRAAITVLILLLSAYFLYTPNYRENLIISFFVLLLTWIIGKK